MIVRCLASLEDLKAPLDGTLKVALFVISLVMSLQAFVVLTRATTLEALHPTFMLVSSVSFE